MGGESAGFEHTDSQGRTSVNRFQAASAQVRSGTSVPGNALMNVEEEIVFRSLVQAMPLAMFVCLYGRIQYANPAGDALLGAEEIEDVIDRDFLRFVHQRDFETVQQLLNAPRREACWKPVCLIQHNGTELIAEMISSDLGEGCVQLIARKSL